LFVAWHNAAARGYLEVFQRIWLWAGAVQRYLHRLKIILLLDKYKDGQNIWNVAVARGNVEVLGNFWSWVKG